MSTLAWIIVAAAAGGVLSVLFAALFLLTPERARTAALPHFVSFATGALLGAALLSLLPQALHMAGAGHADRVGLALVIGILLFFILEKWVLWRHSHDDDGNGHSQAHGHTHAHGAASNDRVAASLILIGDGIHNALDGVAIAAAFMSGTEVGIVTSVAVIAHEIPHEVGAFAILLHGGMSRSRALAFNLLSGLTSVLGGLAAYFALGHAVSALPYAIALAAASLLYVAMADLIPGLHRQVSVGAGARQVALIGVGVALIFYLAD
ncbi:MAG TPA: ZIP family metal transporter [Steroidobacteraceae bacterium]|nr:ZIP family metal transporter [Steroidobacteraceae bacterium]